MVDSALKHYSSISSDIFKTQISLKRCQINAVDGGGIEVYSTDEIKNNIA